MANTKRRAEYIDRNGNMFIPMNVEGGSYNEHFITTPKLACIIGIIVGYVAIIMYIGSINGSFMGYLITLAGWSVITVFLLRFVIFEEKFYYRMYQELKEHEITTPAIFWDIASIKDTEDGAIVTYSDARIAIMVKIDRDTITGKESDFKEMHYDAISDFYREVVNSRYSFIQMNVMEQAGKDPRLSELNKLVNNSDNPNINRLMELEVGYIKNITRTSLYESDYFIFYTTDVAKVDTIINDITECLFKLLDGAYVGYTIMSSKEIVDFVKDQYGVNYFNATEASMNMFSRNSVNILPPFNITGIVWNNSEEQVLNNKEQTILKDTVNRISRETLKQEDVSFKESIYRKPVKKKVGVDFDTLGESRVQTRNNSRQVIKREHINQPNQTAQRESVEQKDLQEQRSNSNSNSSQEIGLNEIGNVKLDKSVNQNSQTSKPIQMPEISFDNNSDEDGFIDL